MRMRTILVLAVAASVLAGCGGGRSSGSLDVVAAENVYGDIAAQIGGAHVSVKSILSDPNADPHLFEPGTANGLAVSHARLVVQNGLGYDDFMRKLEDAAPSSKRRVLVVADAISHTSNPHLWYELPQMGKVGAAIADELSAADPAHAGDYRARAHSFS